MSSDLTDTELADTFISESPSPDLPDDSSVEASPEASAPRREGLPRGFRMRHDAHFVDQLDGEPPPVVRMLPVGGIDAPACDDRTAVDTLARSIERIGIVEPLVVRKTSGRYQVVAGVKRLSAARAARLDRVPCIVRDDLAADALALPSKPVLPQQRLDDRSRGPFSSTARERALDEAIGSMNAARTSVELTLPRGSTLRSRTAADLVRAELLSARQALSAMRILSAPPMIRRSALDPRQLLDAVLVDLAPMLRLSGARVHVAEAGPLPPVIGMRPLAAFAVEACISTVLALAGDAPEPSLAISVTASKEAGTVVLSVRLDGGWLPAETAKRVTDADWTEHPGGTTGAMVAAAAETVARLHDGSLDVSTDYEGFAVALTLRA